MITITYGQLIFLFFIFFGICFVIEEIEISQLKKKYKETVEIVNENARRNNGFRKECEDRFEKLEERNED